MPDRLAEAETGVQHDILRPYAQGARKFGPLAKMGSNIRHNVAVLRGAWQVGRQARHVHQADREIVFGEERGHVGVGAQGADVVYEDCARLDRTTRHIGFIGVHGDRD